MRLGRGWGGKVDGDKGRGKGKGRNNNLVELSAHLL